MKMIFTNCPKCKNQSYLTCGNCEKESEWDLKESEVGCSCGQKYEWFDCKCGIKVYPKHFYTVEKENELIEKEQIYKRKPFSPIVKFGLLFVGICVALPLFFAPNEKESSQEPIAKVKKVDKQKTDGIPSKLNQPKSRENPINNQIKEKAQKIFTAAINKGNIEKIKTALTSDDILKNIPKKDLSQALLIAANNGDSALGRSLVENGADPNFLNGYPLIKSIEKQQGSFTKFLLENGANPKLGVREEANELAITRDGSQKQTILKHYGSPPLLLAISLENIQIVKMLLGHGADIYDSHSGIYDGRNSIFLAIDKGNGAILKALIEHGADLSKSNKWNGPSGYQHALGSGEIESVETALETKKEGLNGNSKEELIGAAKAGSLKYVKLLLDKGVYLNTQLNDDGNTPLNWAVERGHTKIVKLLLDQGAYLKNQSGNSSLPYAAEAGHFEIVKLLINKGDDPNQFAYGRMTPLMGAVKALNDSKLNKLEINDRLDLLGFLIKKGAKLDLKDKYGDTALNQSDKIESAKLLLDKGASQFVSNNFRKTPLIRQVAQGNIEIVKLLLDKEAPLDISDNEGKTPLMVAAEKGHKEILLLLLKKGANPKLKLKKRISGDKYISKTASIIAGENNQPEIANILLQAEANQNE